MTTCRLNLDLLHYQSDNRHSLTWKCKLVKPAFTSWVFGGKGPNVAAQTDYRLGNTTPAAPQRMCGKTIK